MGIQIIVFFLMYLCKFNKEDKFLSPNVVRVLFILKKAKRKTKKTKGNDTSEASRKTDGNVDGLLPESTTLYI